MTDVACDTGGWVPSTPGGERASPAASPMKPPSASSRSRASSAVTPDARSADRPSPRREDDDGVGASIANWFSGVFGGDKDEGSKVEDEDDAAEEKTPPSPRDGRREKRSPNEDDDDHDHDRDRGDDANAASDATATDAATSTSALPSAAPAADVALAKFRADVAVALAIARDALPRRVARNAQLVASLEDLKTFADRDAVLAMADWRVAGGGEDLDAVQVADVKVVVEKEEEEGETLTAVPLEEETTTTTDAKTVGQSWPIRLQLPGLVELAHEDEPGTLSSWTYCDAAAFAVSASAFGGGGGLLLSSARPVFVSPRPTRRSVIYLFVGDVQRTFSVLMRIHVPGTFDCRLPRHRDIFATSSSLTVAVSILATRDARRAIRRISPRAIAIARAF